MPFTQVSVKPASFADVNLGKSLALTDFNCILFYIQHCLAQSALLDGLVLIDRGRRQPEQHREDGGTSVPETSA